MTEQPSCELCGLPIEDIENDAHEEFDGLYHDECCPSCNGAEWKAQRDELRTRLNERGEVIGKQAQQVSDLMLQRDALAAVCWRLIEDVNELDPEYGYADERFAVREARATLAMLEGDK